MKNETIEKIVELYEIKSELSKSISVLMDKEVTGVTYKNTNYKIIPYGVPHCEIKYIDNEEVKRIILCMLKSKLFDIENELKTLEC